MSENESKLKVTEEITIAGKITCGTIDATKISSMSKEDYLKQFKKSQNK